ncbi:hypothetical protein [Fuerstiella marisgermanici]|uniref:hypothetical protein n=1 Tax=Fuerstiella marisgermanici TaxID=1891926 RepID=UPI001C54E00D|nr:hypothetical protein [Fuerstiella marisgermanici]
MFTLVLATLLVPAVTAQDKSGPAREQFVPADQFDAIFERTPNGVMLPRDEFEALLQQAQQAVRSRSELPVPAVIRTASYNVQRSQNHAIVKLSLDIEQFADHWISLNFPIGNLMVEDAKIGDEAAAIGRDPQQGDLLTLMHDKPGRFTLQLTMSTPLGTVGSDRVAAFRVLQNVASNFTVACPPERHLEVGNLKLERPQPISEPAEYTFPAGAAADIQLKWTARRQQTDTQSMVFARTDARLRLTSDNLRWNSQTRLSVFGSSINQVVARVPAQLEVTAVDSAGLESWTLQDDPKQKGVTRVVLNYRQPFSDDRMISIAAVAGLKSDAASTIPTLQLVDVTSHTGQLVVTHEDQLRLLAEAGGGIRQLSTDILSSMLPAGEVFDFWLQDFTLSVSVKPRDRELFAEVNSTLAIEDTQATFRCDMAIETLNDSLYELVLQLPQGWQIRTVADENNNALKWRRGSTESAIVVEPAAPIPAGGLFNVRTTFTRTIEDPATQQTLSLPVITPSETLIVGGTYQISAARDLTMSPLEIQGLAPAGDDDGTLLFETQGSVYSGKLAIERRPVRLSSRSVLRSWMDMRQKTVDAVITVDITNGTTRTLQVTLPADLGEDVRFTVDSVAQVPGFEQQQVPASVSITEQTATEPADGQRTFSLTFDKRFAGAVTIKAFVQQPRTQETQLTAPFAKVTSAVRQHGLVVFEASPEQQLTPAADDLSASGLKPADAGLVEPPAESTGRRTALVYRFIQPDYNLQINETRFDTEAVPSAVCEQIANVSVLSDTGAIQRSSRVSLTCVGVQTLRFTLPDAEESFLWSTILNDEAVEVRRDGDDYLVAIPTGSDQNQHVLEVLFESANTEVSLLGETTQESLQLSIDTDKGAAAPIDILEQTWDVRYPDSALLVDNDGGFHPSRDLEQPGWLQALASMAYLPSTTDALRRLIPLGVFLLGLLVVTALMVRKQKRAIDVLAVLAIIAVLVTLIRPAVQNAREASPRTQALNDARNQALEAEMQSDARYGRSTGSEMDDVAVQSMDAATPEPASEPLGRVSGSRGPEEMFGESSSPGNDASMEGGGFGGSMGGMPMGMAGQGQQRQGQQGGGVAPPVGGTEVLMPLALPRTTPQDAISSPGLSELAARLSGSARLSIRAEIASPQDYRSMTFRSIGGTSEAGTLQVVVQPRSQLNAYRIVAAAIVLLLCLWMNRARLGTKAAVAIVFLLVAVAAVPLLPNQWQSIADGIVLGTLAGIALWIVAAIARCISKAIATCCQSGPRSTFQPRSVTTSGLLLAFAVFAAGGHAVAAPQAEDDNQLRPNVVLPYTPGEPELLADKVYLPRDEFLKLYNAANPGELSNLKLSAPSRVVAAFYKSGELKQVKDATWSQAFTVRYVIHSSSNKPIDVALPIGPVAIRSAKLDEGDAVLLPQERAPIVRSPNTLNQAPNQQAAQAKPQQPQQQQQLQQAEVAQHIAAASGYTARIPEPGAHVLDVAFEVPATVESSVGRLQLPVRPVPAGTVAFELPGEGLAVRVNGQSNAFRQQERSVVIPVADANGVQIAWRPEATQTAADTSYHATVNSALTIDDAGLTSRSTIAINCRQGTLAEVEIGIPQDYAVQSVEGADIAGWNVPDDDAQTLRLLFRQPVEAATRIDLTLFRREVFSTDKVNVAVPVPVVKGASRDSGNVTILAGRELEVRVDSLSGVSQINAAESALPNGAGTKAPRVLAWRYTRHPVAISVKVFRTADRMNVISLNGVQLEPQRQLWTTLITANVSGSPRRRLEIEVPSDFLALDVNANNLADWYFSEATQENATTKTLNVQLQAAQQGTITVTLRGQTGRTGGTDAAKMLVPRVVGADEVATQVSIWLDEASEISGSSADGWKRSGSAIDPRLKKLQPDAADISFTSNAAKPNPIELTLRQAPASLIAESVTVTNVTDTSVELTLGLNWQITRAATRQLSFTIPAELEGVFDFRIPGLRQLEYGSPADGRIPVTVHLQQPASEQFFIVATGTLPLPDSKQITASPPQFVVGAEGSGTIASQSHFWVIVNQSAGLLEAVNMQTDGADVAPEDIRTKIPEGFLQQSVAIRRLKSGQPNSQWILKFPERQQVAPAVIALAAHTTVIAEDGTWRSRHALQVRNESRQFLPVMIPQTSRFLYCLVKGVPTRVVSRLEGEQTIHLIPVPQSGEISTPFDVEFALAGLLSVSPNDIAGQQLNIPAPEFPEYRDFPDYGIAVSRNTWSVFVPESWHAAVVDDPRQTNVVPATQTDFTEAELLSYVDNAKSIANAVKSLGGSNAPGRLHGFREQIEIQQRNLQQQLGNTAESESQRNEALQQLGEVLQRQDNYSRSGGYGGANSSGAIRSGTVLQRHDSNRYLMELEQTQNGFNSANVDGLFFGNTIRGLPANESNAADADDDTNFDFGIQWDEESREFDQSKTRAVDEKSDKGQSILGKQPDAQKRSQLLNRRELNFKKQSQKAKAQTLQYSDQRAEPNAAGRGITADPFQSLDVPLILNRQSAPPAAAFVVPQQAAVPEVEELDAAGMLVPSAAPAAGLLSIDFQIPADGIRHDFIRPGGNAELTLTVRDRKTIHFGLGILWSLACLIVAVILLKGVSSGNLNLRISLLASVIGLAGWLCLPGDIRYVALTVCIAAAICVCISILRNREPRSVVAS